LRGARGLDLRVSGPFKRVDVSLTCPHVHPSVHPHRAQLVRTTNKNRPLTRGPPSLKFSTNCNYIDTCPKSPLALAMSYTGFWDELRKIPPVTRFLCGSSLAVSVPVMMQLLSPYKVIFVRALVTQRFEVRLSIAKERVSRSDSRIISCGGSGRVSSSEVCDVSCDQRCLRC
jgi:hypothetical protein